MFHIPMSSPMMNRMLGFLSCAWAETATSTAINGAIQGVSIFGFIVGWLLLQKAGGSFEPPAAFVTRLLAFVLLHHRLDLGLNGVEVEGGRILHRRIVNCRHCRLRYDLLHEHKTPELAGEEIVGVAGRAGIKAFATEARQPLKWILTDIDQFRHVRGRFLTGPAPRLLEEDEFEVIEANGSEVRPTKVEQLMARGRAFAFQ